MIAKNSENEIETSSHFDHTVRRDLRARVRPLVRSPGRTDPQLAASRHGGVGHRRGIRPVSIPGALSPAPASDRWSGTRVERW